MVKELQNKIKDSKGRSILWVVLGLLVLIVVLMISSFWFLKTAQKTTENSVYDVSEVYLQELTKQKINQFQINLENQVRQLRIAIATFDAEDTGSKEKFQNCIKETNKVSEFDFFALLDNEGNIYTESDVINDSSQYPFIDSDLKTSKVSLEKVDEKNMIMVMVPLEDTSFEGRKITGAVAGVNAGTFSEKVFTQYDFGRIFCEVIMADGSFVIKTNHNHLKEKVNLFSGLGKEAVFGDGFSIEKLKSAIDSGKSGVASYYLEDILHYTYYAPIEGTDWYMKTTIHYDLVSSKIDAVRLTMIRNSLIQLALVILILLAVFGIYLSVRRKNDKLNYQRIQAEESNRAKSTFLSNMSHDIRTPMNAIIGFTNLAIQSKESMERVQGYLAKILASSNHLLTLINDVLEMSRIESGKIYLDETECNLSEILHDLNTIIIGQIEGKQQELLMDAVDVMNEDVYCDKLRLNQILLNLLSNAIKFTPSGGKISVQFKQKEGAPEGYGAYELRVKDSGIGMTQEFADKVFTPFERERTSTVSGIQGTGLGMAITKSIVDLMDGRIEVKTAPDQGTEFIIHMNFRLQETQREYTPIAELTGVKALVVDDDFDACDAATRMLLKLGMQSEWTLSGKEAVLRTKQSVSLNDAFGVYIIDWRLPDLGGVEVARQIRAIVGDSAPILIMTAYDWANIEDEARAAGVNAFCSKPMFMSDLQATLSKAIGQQVMIPESSDTPEETADFTGKRVLLVEDNELNREIAHEILSQAGFEVEAAEDGSIAVEIVKESKPGYYDLILMDVQMPIMNGYEATRAIRSLEDKELASIVIIAMTANAFEEDKKAALDAGMNDHIAKPIDIEVLFEVLGKVCNG